MSIIVKKKYLRMIEWDESKRPVGGAEVLSAVAGPISISHKEPAGHLFHLFILKQAKLWIDPAAAEAEAEAAAAAAANKAGIKESPSASDLDTETPPNVEWKGKKKAKKTTGGKNNEFDFYRLLGLSNERWMATENQIKMGYRKACLESHPDKALVGISDLLEKQKAEDKFKKIQEAYETLSDPAKRREYDSTDEFDDSLPLECDPKDFFKVFAPAFRRNARWSSDKKVPDAGDANTPYDQVLKFYDFWFAFKSWREFPHPDEEDEEQAENREHRRWIQRNNSKLREKGKKDEVKRIREFVEAAMKYDPRVLKKKEEEKAERERKKAEKEEARRRAQEEVEAQKAAEEAAKKAAEEAEKARAEEAKRLRNEAKSNLKKERKRLRAQLVGGNSTAIATDDETEKIASRFDCGPLADLCDALEAAKGDAVAQRVLVDEALAELKRRDTEEALAKEVAKREAEEAFKAAAANDHARRLAAMREWDSEELRLLDKAVNKFPMGTPKRWEAVATFVRTRTLEEVLLMVKEKQGMSSNRVKAQEDWKGAQKKRAEVTSTLDARMNAFTDVKVTLEGRAAEVLGVGTGGVVSSLPSSSVGKSSVGGGGVPAVVAVAAAATTTTTSTSTAQQAAGVAASAATPAAPAKEKKAVSASSGEWSEAQEQALVAALKTCPKELGAERWDKVSGLVPGKTKAQCFKRFKELREIFRSKKTEGGADAGGDDE